MIPSEVLLMGLLIGGILGAGMALPLAAAIWHARRRLDVPPGAIDGPRGLLLVVGALVSCSCGALGGDDDDDFSTVPCGETPSVAECQDLCDDACSELSACGPLTAPCQPACEQIFACPGETLDHDAAICDGEREALAGEDCSGRCEWAETFGGHGYGVSCEDVH